MGIIETEKMLNIEQGKEIGKEIGSKNTKLEEREILVKKLIVKLAFTDQQAADFAEVSLSFVKKIRTQLEKSNRSKN